MTATRPEAKPCRVRLQGGTVTYIALHHRTVQKAIREAARAGNEFVTIAGTVIRVAEVVIVLPARRRRGEPTAPPYRPYNQKESRP